MQTRNKATAALLALTLAMGVGVAQAQATDGDKEFLKDTAQDSAFEIRSGELALQKSSSPDVKAYAEMVIRDHHQLEQQVKSTDAAVNVTPPSPGSMAVGDDARYAELKVLSGESFDKAYIKGLLKGNQESMNHARSEVAGTAVPAIKSLAEHRLALDTKHTRRAEALAQAHHIEAQ